jgi:bacillithiol system protein YtxJ
MGNPFIEISDPKKLDELLTESNERPVVLFKHSEHCSISSWAYRELETLSDPIKLVVVQSARTLSNEISTRMGIKHESPQAIVLRNGKPVWTGSHGQVTAAAITQAIREHQ